MLIQSQIIFSGVVLLMAASAALAKDDVLPKIDLQKRCRSTQNATDALTGTKNPNAFDLCMNSEQSAREKLVERWALFCRLQIELRSFNRLVAKLFRMAWVHDTKSTCERCGPSARTYVHLCAVPDGDLATGWLVTGVVACQLR